jgi:hypothetical protein
MKRKTTVQLMDEIKNFGRAAVQERGPTTNFPATTPVAQLARATLFIQPATDLIFDSLNSQRRDVSAISLFNSNGDFGAKILCVFGFTKFHGLKSAPENI